MSVGQRLLCFPSTSQNSTLYISLFPHFSSLVPPLLLLPPLPPSAPPSECNSLSFLNTLSTLHLLTTPEDMLLPNPHPVTHHTASKQRLGTNLN